MPDAHPPLAVPSGFAERMGAAFGAAGLAWLRDLPALVADLAAGWGLVVGPPFDLSYNYVAPARRHDGAEAVLKVGVPRDELAREIGALRLYGGDGACRLLEADEARAAMLLERLLPGARLADLARTDDDEATRVGATVMRRLWRLAPDASAGRGFKPLAEWFAAFERHRVAFGGPGPLPAALLERAEALARDLVDSAPAVVLLHGDFHHDNVLTARRSPWLAIDPKGMLGDPGYDAGPFLLNPDPKLPNKRPALLRRRLDLLAEMLDYDRDRLRDWGVVHAVLSACWSAEEGGGWEGAVATARALIAS
jgi:streptomycin 6-kinase